MTGLEFGAVVLARVPYSDQQQSKLRPAVIVSSPQMRECHGDIILFSITSRMKPSLPFKNLEIRDWQSAGLPKPSMFKPGLFTLLHTEVDRIFGKLSDKDSARLKQLLSEMLVL